jgi:hypothetical protein
MLVIRAAQFKALEVGITLLFQDRLVEHAETFFPAVCEELGPKLRDAVGDSIALAARYGFRGQREACKFLNLQLSFGQSFDRDPRCGWAHALLRGGLPGVPKMEQLYRLALQHEKEARGYFAATGEAR